MFSSQAGMAPLACSILALCLVAAPVRAEAPEIRFAKAEGLILAAAPDTVQRAPADPGELKSSEFAGSIPLSSVTNPMETLKDLKVMNVRGDRVGDVRAIVLNTKGEVEGVQVEAGGFLGMGEKIVTFDPRYFVYLPAEKHLVTRLSKDDVLAIAGIVKTMIQPNDVPGSVALANAGVNSTVFATTQVQTVDGDKIGTVRQVLFTHAGRPVAFDVDVGGFLGIGEKIVRVDADHFVYLPQGNVLVTRMDKSELKNLADAVGEPVRPIEMAGATPAAGVTNAGKVFDGLAVESITGDAIGTVEQVFVDANGRALALQVEIGGFLGLTNRHARIGARNFALLPDRNVLVTALSKEDLTALPYVQVNSDAVAPVLVPASSVIDPATTFENMKVRNTADESIGEVHEVVIDNKGMAVTLRVEVGGFLGIGETVISLNAADLQYHGGDKILITPLSKADIEQLPKMEK